VIVVMTRDNTRLHNEQYLKHSTAIHLFWESGARDLVNVAPFQLGKERRLLVQFAGSSQSFWKRGSFRSGSNIGSSRSSRTVKIIQKKTERFPAAFKVRNDLLTQGYGIDRAKSSTLLSKSTEAESSADKSPNKKLMSVHSQNSATTEQL
jgi:hypothetical protein